MSPHDLLGPRDGAGLQSVLDLARVAALRQRLTIPFDEVALLPPVQRVMCLAKALSDAAKEDRDIQKRLADIRGIAVLRDEAKARQEQVARSQAQAAPAAVLEPRGAAPVVPSSGGEVQQANVATAGLIKSIRGATGVD